ncbi:DUF4199 domain-containing protein [Glacieibacterium frigidum]|uniref:DUF4199 domain-containing protein n=1 Tax=Glacieibacterium frigidum TaxID=2593303 RepID=A0A552U6Z0_9SPHN|nr:DUF4199 domain-containing protein [Glacieibacterium frigidum]TRW13986.1 DUF4199 domain-containing protein [Glacieibacterium frigidum]
MLRQILTYGTIAGLIVGSILGALTVASAGQAPGPYGMAIGYLTMLIALSTIFVAIKRRRDVDGGGVIRFWPALGLGVGISVVAGIFYVAAWEAATAFTGLDFGRVYADALIAQEKAKGVSGAALARFTADMRAFEVQYADPLWRLPMVFSEILPVGVLVSLISAGLLANRRFLPARRV